MKFDATRCSCIKTHHADREHLHVSSPPVLVSSFPGITVWLSLSDVEDEEMAVSVSCR